MDTLIIVVLFLAFATGIFALGTAFAAPGPVGDRIRYLLASHMPQRKKPAVKERVEQILEPLSKAIPKSPDDVSTTSAWLMQAGYRQPSHLKFYYGIRVLVAGLCAVVCVVTGLFARQPVAAVAMVALGYMLPRFILKRKISARQLAIQLALPDALDLAVICVEAGLGLDQAVSRVANELKHSHPALSDELLLVGLEMRAGKARADALRNLALRTGVDDIRAFVAVLIQTDRFGTSIASALRVHSDALRTERHQRAEERAAKTTIKMIPVLVFFVFPAIFIVTIGPAVIGLIREVLPVIDK